MCADARRPAAAARVNSPRGGERTAFRRSAAETDIAALRRPHRRTAALNVQRPTVTSTTPPYTRRRAAQHGFAERRQKHGLSPHRGANRRRAQFSALTDAALYCIADTLQTPTRPQALLFAASAAVDPPLPPLSGAVADPHRRPAAGPIAAQRRCN